MFRIVAPKLGRRLFAITCAAIGLLAVGLSEHLVTPLPSRFLVVLPVEVPPEDPLGGRDLNDYDVGGHIEECSSYEGPNWRQCLTVRDEARTFIYESWQSKKRAYISVEFSCVDCAPVLHIIVEPDATGRWRIIRTLEERRFGVFQRADAYDIKFRAVDAHQRSREGSNRALAFLDLAGDEIDTF